MLHKLSLYTIEYFLSFLPAPHDEDQKEIYVYGLECFFEYSHSCHPNINMVYF